MIDMSAYAGGHPTMGAVDLVPLYPLGEEVGLGDCAKEARGVCVCGVRVPACMCLHFKALTPFFSLLSSSCCMLYTCEL